MPSNTPSSRDPARHICASYRYETAKLDPFQAFCGQVKHPRKIAYASTCALECGKNSPVVTGTNSLQERCQGSRQSSEGTPASPTVQDFVKPALMLGRAKSRFHERYCACGLRFIGGVIRHDLIHPPKNLAWGCIESGFLK
jgi:hypothetical protein